MGHGPIVRAHISHPIKGMQAELWSGYAVLDEFVDFSAVGECGDGAAEGVDFFPLVGAFKFAGEEASQGGDVVVGEGDGEGFDGGVEMSDEGGECAGEEASSEAFSLGVFPNDEHGEACDFEGWESDEEVDGGGGFGVDVGVVGGHEVSEDARALDVWGRGSEGAGGESGWGDADDGSVVVWGVVEDILDGGDVGVCDGAEGDLAIAKRAVWHGGLL